jgi:hypothetical protein
LTEHVQKAVTGPNVLAPEYTEIDLSPDFRSNGTHNPNDAGYQKLAMKRQRGESETETPRALSNTKGIALEAPEKDCSNNVG